MSSRILIVEDEPRIADFLIRGLTEEEIAESLGVTTRTVRRDWEKARLLLAEALK